MPSQAARFEVVAVGLRLKKKKPQIFVCGFFVGWRVEPSA